MADGRLGFRSVGEFPDDDTSPSESSSFHPPHEFQDALEEDENPKPTKMFWHSFHITKVQELVPEEVRWFYKEDSKAKWTAFIGYDSLRIECRFRALEFSKQRSNNPDAVDMDTCIHVRGGLYEVDINNGVVHPVYWKGDSLPILRGTWFLEGSWQPLEYEYSLQLEQDHLTKFRGQKLPASTTEPGKRPKLEVQLNVQFADFHVDWYGVDEVYMFSESTGSRMFRYVTKQLHIQKSGTGMRLSRGYCEEAKMDDKPSDVTHLVFVVHGIGQKYNQNRIITCCNELRNGSSRVINKYFPDLPSNSRIEFLPVEWRTDLQLDGDMVEAITPDKLRGLRNILNSTAMDILYYTSPLYRSEIISGLSAELNRLYSMFCERHPYFEANSGQVSVAAHSLGSVILYDILTGWDPIELYDQYVCNVVREHSDMNVEANSITSVTSADRSKQLHDFYINSIIQKNESTLQFKVANMFNLGSPLGVFLTLRGIRPKPNGLMDHLLPKALCKRFFNIYHPSDPVAYRIEPLVLRHYSTIAPLKIHRIHDANKTPYTKMKAKAYAALGVKKGKKKEEVSTADLTPPSAAAGGITVGGVTVGHTFDEMTDAYGAGSLSESSLDSSVSFRGSPARQADHRSPNHSGPSSGTTTPRSQPPTQQPSRLTGALKGIFSRFGGRNTTTASKLSSEMDVCVTSGEEDNDDVTDQAPAQYSESACAEQTELEYRLDYVLPSSSMSNSYVGAIFSHTSYWSSPEIAMFLLSHIFPDYGPVNPT